MVGRLVGGAVNLAGSIEYSVQARWTVFISFEWPLPLTGLGATESGVDRRVFGILVDASALVFIASWLAIAIPGSRSAGGRWYYCFYELASYLLPRKSGS